MQKLRFMAFLFIAGLVLPLATSGCSNQAAVNGINPYEGKRVDELPRDDRVRIALAAAQELESVGLYAEAIVQYERARKMDPTELYVTRRLAVLYDQIDRYTRAKEEYVSALTYFPNDATLLSDYGYFLYRRDDLERSEQMLIRATEADPYLDVAWINLGVTLAEMGRYKESLDAFQTVRPAPEALSNLGTIMARQGNYDQAREALEEAIRLDKNLIEAQAVLDAIDEYEGK